eukprot:14116038-Alexandrium_andersonii.AAC.1
MIRRPPRSTRCISSAASDVYKRQDQQRAPVQDEASSASNSDLEDDLGAIEEGQVDEDAFDPVETERLHVGDDAALELQRT